MQRTQWALGMKIVVQLLKEFWIPLLVSILWATYNIADGAGETWDIKRFINTIAPTFFITSWMTGQVFRVKKQGKVEGSLDKMEGRLESLLEELDTKTREMIDHVTGGDSFPWIQVAMVDPKTDQGMLMVNHHGDHPLYDVSVRIVDLNIFFQIQGAHTLSTFQLSDTNINIGNLISGHSMSLRGWSIKHSPAQSYNVFFAARNGSFTQLVRMRKINGKWLTATKVSNQNNEVLHEQIDTNFPRNIDGTIAW